MEMCFFFPIYENLTQGKNCQHFSSLMIKLLHLSKFCMQIDKNGKFIVKFDTT